MAAALHGRRLTRSDAATASPRASAHPACCVSLSLRPRRRAIGLKIFEEAPAPDVGEVAAAWCVCAQGSTLGRGAHGLPLALCALQVVPSKVYAEFQSAARAVRIRAVGLLAPAAGAMRMRGRMAAHGGYGAPNTEHPAGWHGCCARLARSRHLAGGVVVQHHPRCLSCGVRARRSGARGARGHVRGCAGRPLRQLARSQVAPVHAARNRGAAAPMHAAAPAHATGRRSPARVRVPIGSLVTNGFNVRIPPSATQSA